MEEKQLRFGKYISFIIVLLIPVFLYYGTGWLKKRPITGQNTLRVVSSSISDLDKDGRKEIIILTGKEGEYYGDGLIIFEMLPVAIPDSIRSGPLIQIFSYSLGDLKPWKVQAADVDGDGKEEISVGVYKEARFHQVLAKRPFLFNWHGDTISPKWLGSRLARPFEDYIFADIDADGLDELVSIELSANGEKLLNSYKWKGFGFESIGESTKFKDISSLEKRFCLTGESFDIVAKVKTKGRWEWKVFGYSEGNLVMR